MKEKSLSFHKIVYLSFLRRFLRRYDVAVVTPLAKSRSFVVFVVLLTFLKQKQAKEVLRCRIFGFSTMSLRQIRHPMPFFFPSRSLFLSILLSRSLALSDLHSPTLSLLRTHTHCLSLSVSLSHTRTPSPLSLTKKSHLFSPSLNNICLKLKPNKMAAVLCIRTASENEELCKKNFQ